MCTLLSSILSLSLWQFNRSCLRFPAVPTWFSFSLSINPLIIADFVGDYKSPESVSIFYFDSSIFRESGSCGGPHPIQLQVCSHISFKMRVKHFYCHRMNERERNTRNTCKCKCLSILNRALHNKLNEILNKKKTKYFNSFSSTLLLSDSAGTRNRTRN